MWSAGLCAAIGLLAVFIVSQPRAPIETLPSNLPDAEFWRIVSEFSEPDGFFRSDNFVSNESTFQEVIPELSRRTKPGGVYLGVGPDQNFTYIAALQPKLAFIVDIRRQNMLEHLMYKAIMEMSANRAEFLSMLFSRPLPESVPDDSTADELFDAFDGVEPSAEQFDKNLDRILNQLETVHGFGLDVADTNSIQYVYEAFRTAGPDIRYSYPSQWGWRRFPSYADLMMEHDLDGKNRSYMASEKQFQLIKEFETENRIVPIVGNFAGDKALPALARYLNAHDATVAAFYTSNVEFYLFQSEDWKRFFGNVSRLPLDDTSTFIRSYFNNGGLRFPAQRVDQRSVTLLDGMADVLGKYADGSVRTYPELIKRSLDPAY